MDIDIRGFVRAHLLGEGATHPSRPPSGALAAQANPRDTTGIAAVCVLPAHPMTACSGAFNCGFQDDFVIPAKAGIQERFLEITVSGFPLSRE